MLNGATKVHGGYVGSGVWCVGVPVWGMWAKLGKSAQQHDRPKIEKKSKISKNIFFLHMPQIGSEGPLGFL